MDMSGKTIDSVMLTYVGIVALVCGLSLGIMGAGYALALAAGLGKGASVVAGIGSLFGVCSAGIAGEALYDKHQLRKREAARKAKEALSKPVGSGIAQGPAAPGKWCFVEKLSKRFFNGARKQDKNRPAESPQLNAPSAKFPGGPQ